MARPEPDFRKGQEGGKCHSIEAFTVVLLLYCATQVPPWAATGGHGVSCPCTATTARVILNILYTSIDRSGITVAFNNVGVIVHGRSCGCCRECSRRSTNREHDESKPFNWGNDYFRDREKTDLADMVDLFRRGSKMQ